MHLLFLRLATVTLTMHFYCLLPAYIISQSSVYCSTSSFDSNNYDTMPYNTACLEHSYLTTTPSTLLLLLTRLHTLHCHIFFLFAFLVLCGDVELCPGLTSLTVCTLNIHCILHPLQCAAILYFTYPCSLDIFCYNWSWIKPTMTFTELPHCTPPNCCLFSFLETNNKKRLLRLSTVTLVFLSVSLSHSYPPNILNSPSSNNPLKLWNCLNQQYWFSIYMEVFHITPSANLFLLLLINKIHSFPLLLPDHMYSSSPVSLTYATIIIESRLPVSFTIFCHNLS